MMRLTEIGRTWGVTPEERAATYPCHRYATSPYVSLLRGVSVKAEPATVFRWLCQLKVAPYSYDWLDNFGRRSPRSLTPGADNLAVGQRFLIANITEFEWARHITGVSFPAATKLFGPIAMTYLVSAHEENHSRLVVCLAVTSGGGLARLRATLLQGGDLVMMRKQLLTLKKLAETSQQ